MKVKICGVMRPEDASMCEDLGADAVGFIHYPGRSRSLSLQSISEMCQSLGPMTSKVLVCKPDSVDSSLEMLAVTGVDVLQSYSLEPNQLVELRDRGVKVMRVVRPRSDDAGKFFSAADALVFESGVPGTGSTYDYSEIPSEFRNRAIIAGGLSPENVHIAKALRPYGVDVSSGVESEFGRKDPTKVEMFIRRCRE